MEQHVKIIGIIYIVFGALLIFGGLLLMLGLMIGGAALEVADPEGIEGIGAILAGVGFVAGLFVIAFGALEIIVAVNLRNFKPWARIAQIVISALGLLNFPIGTAIGVYALWALLNKDTVPLFEEASGGAA